MRGDRPIGVELDGRRECDVLGCATTIVSRTLPDDSDSDSDSVIRSFERGCDFDVELDDVLPGLWCAESRAAAFFDPAVELNGAG